jgi:hypothetical protein
VDANIVRSKMVEVFNSDFTVASGTASTIQLPATYTNGDSLPDDDRYQFTELSIVGGTGAGQVVLLGAATANAREYNILAGTMPVTVSTDSTAVVLGSWQARTVSGGSAVTVFSGQLSGHQVDLLSGRSYTASGIFAVATATVGSGTVWLASGSVILPSGGLVGVFSGTLVNVFSGQNVNVWSGQLSGQPLSLLSGLSYPASGVFTAGASFSGQVYVASGSIIPQIFDADGIIESGLTFRQSQRLVAAAAAGELSGAGTGTIRIRNTVADFKTRITATVDASGNRTSITTDVT